MKTYRVWRSHPRLLLVCMLVLAGAVMLTSVWFRSDGTRMAMPSPMTVMQEHGDDECDLRGALRDVGSSGDYRLNEPVRASAQSLPIQGSGSGATELLVISDSSTIIIALCTAAPTPPSVELELRDHMIDASGLVEVRTNGFHSWVYLFPPAWTITTSEDSGSELMTIRLDGKIAAGEIEANASKPANCGSAPHRGLRRLNCEGIVQIWTGEWRTDMPVRDVTEWDVLLVDSITSDNLGFFLYSEEYDDSSVRLTFGTRYPDSGRPELIYVRALEGGEESVEIVGEP